MKNTNAKGFDRGKKDAKDGGLYTVPTRPKCFRCQGFIHMKQEYLTYLKTIGKSKAFAATLSDTEPEDESNENDDEGILNAFTAIVDLIEWIVEEVDEEEDLVESKF